MVGVGVSKGVESILGLGITVGKVDGSEIGEGITD
jgi:hypothetical protein